jgi:hypothetical protein
MIVSRLQSLSFRGSWVLLIGIGLYIALQLPAEESLISNPPFKPVDRGSTRPVSQNISTQGSINERFELASIFKITGTLKFSIYDKQTNKPFWLKIGESIEGVRIESYDPEKFGIVVNQSGQREMLVLREMKQNSNVRGNMPSYNTISAIQNYPKPPPSLPEPNKLIEQLRRKKD